MLDNAVSANTGYRFQLLFQQKSSRLSSSHQPSLPNDHLQYIMTIDQNDNMEILQSIFIQMETGPKIQCTLENKMSLKQNSCDNVSVVLQLITVEYIYLALSMWWTKGHNMTIWTALALHVEEQRPRPRVPTQSINVGAPMSNEFTFNGAPTNMLFHHQHF